MYGHSRLTSPDDWSHLQYFEKSISLHVSVVFRPNRCIVSWIGTKLSTLVASLLVSAGASRILQSGFDMYHVPHTLPLPYSRSQERGTQSSCEATQAAYLILLVFASALLCTIQDVDALDADFVAKRAQSSGRHNRQLDMGANTESLVSDVNRAKDTNVPVAIDLRDDRNSKRPRRSLRRISTDGEDLPGPARAKDIGDKRLARRVDRLGGSGGGGPVVVFLACDDFELERGKLLCQELRQRKLLTSMHKDATHVVIGNQHTADTNGGDGDSAYDNSSGLELVTHGIEGYMEAVMLGLWVVDFSWVEECLKPSLRSDRRNISGDARAGNDERGDSFAVARTVSSTLAPPRRFELYGCTEQHKGCDPRRGRTARSYGVPAVFSGLAVCIVGEGRSESEMAKYKRLLRFGQGVLMDDGKTPERGGGRKEGWVEVPFALENASNFSSTEVARKGGSSVAKCQDRDQTSAGRGNAIPVRLGDALKSTDVAVGKKVVVVALSDLPGGGVSSELSKLATDRSEEIGASPPAVDEGWIVRSIEEGSPAALASHRASRFGGRAPSPVWLDGSPTNKRARTVTNTGTGADLSAGLGTRSGAHVGAGRDLGASPSVHGSSSDERTKPVSKSRLSLKPISSSGKRREVVLDIDDTQVSRHQDDPKAVSSRGNDSSRVRSDTPETESTELMRAAQKVVEVSDSAAKHAATAVQPVGLGAKGFEFTRVGSKKEVRALTVSLEPVEEVKFEISWWRTYLLELNKR